jgi:hypothetical protein
MALGHRWYAMTELGNRYFGLSKYERFMHSQVGHFFMINLMGPWTDMLKRMSTLLSSDNLLTWAGNYKNLTPYQRAQMASLGIGERMAKRIYAQWQNVGSPTTSKGLLISSADDWVDRQARDTFRAAAYQWVEIQVPTPDKVLDKPNFMVKQDWAKMMLQYKTFPLMATWKVMGNAASYADAQKMSGLLTMVGMAYLVDLTVRRPEYMDMDFEQSLLRAIELSGVTGIIMDANDQLERALGVGLRPMLGLEGRERKPTIATKVGAVGGAVVNQWATLGWSLMSDDATNKDRARAFRYMIPFNNLLGVKGTFNRVQRHGAEWMDDAQELIE